MDSQNSKTHPPFACPRCRQKLFLAAKTYHCPTPECGSFPNLFGIPYLCPDPDAELASWHLKAHELVSSYHSRTDSLAYEQKLISHPLTKKRLAKLIQAYREQASSLQKLLKPVFELKDLDIARHLIKAKTPASQQLESYYDNVFRDWVWGQEENEKTLELALELLASTDQSSEVLVLGGGAGRFAYDLQNHRPFQTLVMQDINPLLMAVCARMREQRSVKLFEFPLAPKSLDQCAIAHTIKPPSQPFAMELVLADAFSPCFAPSTLSGIITPWFIDIVHEDTRNLARQLNSLLKPGGFWLNFGSLAYFHAEKRFSYSPEEVLAILAEEGFQIEKHLKPTLPYLPSPHSAGQRLEQHFAFIAYKKGPSLEPPSPPQLKPAWLEDPHIPIPKLPYFKELAQANQLFVRMVAPIDGEASVRTIALSLLESLQLTEKQGIELVKTVLWDVVQKQQKHPRFR